MSLMRGKKGSREIVVREEGEKDQENVAKGKGGSHLSPFKSISDFLRLYSQKCNHISSTNVICHSPLLI